MMRARLLIAGLLLAAALVVPQRADAAPITYYQVNFDTTGLPDGVILALDVQLNDGSGTGDGTSQATLSDFVYGSGSYLGNAVSGGVTEQAGPAFTMADTSFFNQLIWYFVRGNSLSFRLGLALDGPTDTPDLFTMAILYGAEIPTAGPFGTEFISADTANPNPVGYRSVSTEWPVPAPTITPEVSRIPEPSSALLLVPGLVGLVSLRRRARQSQAA